MRVGLTILIAMGWLSAAFGQAAIVPAPTVAPASASTEAVPETPALALGQQHRFAAQLQFGYPTGLRMQYTLHQWGDHSYVAEVFGGAQSAFWGKNQVMGAGGRALITLATDHNKNALLFGPGLGVSWWQADKPGYFAPGDFAQTDRYFLTMDANIGWLRELSPSFGLEVGVNVGLRVGLDGHEQGGRSISGKVSGGTIGLYTGFRY